ncbi:MAG: putative D--3-hydroxybutyrate oligomer hydrolase lipoprotein transrane [Polaromonas sp.]|nr:putative D--3-hydroxybutyrate oligomer hydrolase lipoprotein transrane [Polaromonas sp.]
MKFDIIETLSLTAVAAAVLLVSGCGGGSGSGSGGTSAEARNVKPAYLGAVVRADYDGNTDDLLTAGLGKTGLGGAAAPVSANPLSPTGPELRKIAIFNNYRAILDITAAGGYGTLYGPNVDARGVVTANEGKIAGSEYIAYSDDGTGQQNITMLVQVPASFNPDNPCIVTATSSGSRGVYGAIGSSGEWGLKNNCAVAYTDKGTGNGIHDLQNNTVSVQNGTRADAAAAGRLSIFTASLTDAARNAFNALTPNRFAIKHAHSQQNPEKDWGKWTLQSIEFAYFVLNERYGATSFDGTTRLKRLVPGNTIVIASSVSNGAGAALAAAEQDTQGLISGVAVAEPQMQLVPDSRLSVRRGAVIQAGTGRSLYDYSTLANLLQPCAGLVSPATNAFNTTVGTPAGVAIAANRCSALQANGLITGATTAEQAASAMATLQAAGWQPESNDLQASHYSFATLPVTLTYANTYGRFSVADNLCNYSYAAAAATGAPAPLAAAALATTFGTGNGVPPTAGINIINNASVGGPLVDATSLSGTGIADYNTPGALCLRELAVGTSPNARRVQQGVGEVLRTANLRGKPALIVHGRSDTLVPTAHTSRPYFGLNKIVEGANSKLSYIEVTNAQHFDAFLGFPGYANRFVPLHSYFIQAMDLMYANLKSGTALPQSQVVRAVPRGLTGAVANPITAANVPLIKTTAAAADQITFSNNVVVIAD